MQLEQLRFGAAIPETVYEKSLEKALDKFSTKLLQILNAGILFADNFDAEIVTVTSDAIAGTEFSVAHTLKRVMVGRLILHQDKAGSLYHGPLTGTSWTTTAGYFKCDVASVTFKLLVF